MLNRDLHLLFHTELHNCLSWCRWKKKVFRPRAVTFSPLWYPSEECYNDMCCKATTQLFLFSVIFGVAQLLPCIVCSYKNPASQGKIPRIGLISSHWVTVKGWWQTSHDNCLESDLDWKIDVIWTQLCKKQSWFCILHSKIIPEFPYLDYWELFWKNKAQWFH